MSDFQELFQGYDQSRVSSALARAKLLAEDPKLQAAFENADKEELLRTLRTLSDQDKKQAMKAFLSADNRELFQWIKKLR